MQIESERSTSYLLEQWAAWALTGGENLSYPHVEPFARTPSAATTPQITDEEATAIDGIVARLMKRDPQMGNVTVDYFMTGCNVSAISRRYRISRAQVDVLVRSGIAWVDATRMAYVEAA